MLLILQVKDSAGNIATATAKVVVDCPDAVYTEDQFAVTEVGTTVDVPTTVGGGVPPYKIKIVRKPDSGKITDVMITDTDLIFTYMPDDNYCTLTDYGVGDSFDFEVSEVYGSTAGGYIEITVNCPMAPITVPELFFNMTPQTNLSIDLGVSAVGGCDSAEAQPPHVSS